MQFSFKITLIFEAEFVLKSGHQINCSVKHMKVNCEIIVILKNTAKVRKYISQTKI